MRSLDSPSTINTALAQYWWTPGDFTLYRITDINAWRRDNRAHSRSSTATPKPCEITFNSNNMNVIIVYFRLSLSSGGYGQKNVFVTEQDWKAGRVTIPSELAEKPNKIELWLIGENKYGRLKRVEQFLAKDQG